MSADSDMRDRVGQAARRSVKVRLKISPDLQGALKVSRAANRKQHCTCQHTRLRYLQHHVDEHGQEVVRSWRLGL